MRMPARLGAVLAGTVLVLAVGGTAPASASGRTVHPHASTAHPYSNPVWWPLASAAFMNCMKDNPGCPPSQVQNYWSWDINGQREPAGEFHQKVYAMGAGIVHIMTANETCGGTNEARGNSIYIDHGAGIISMYSHLASNFLVANGDYVSARTPIGYMGNSGYRLCAQKPNVRFLAVVVEHDAVPVKNGGVSGTYVQIKHTYACVGGARQNWPADLPGDNGWSRWFEVPVGHEIPDTGATRGCIHTPPATAPRPADAALRKSSASSLKGSWRQAAAKYHVGTVLAQLQQYHPGNKTWTDLRAHSVSGGATSTNFTGLTHNGDYRMRVWFKNSIGWSAATHWTERVLS